MDPEIDLSTADRDAFIAIIASQQAIFERLEKRIDQLKRPLGGYQFRNRQGLNQVR